MTDDVTRPLRRKRTHRGRLVVEFPRYTELGSDGLDHIATVASTPADADAVTAMLLRTDSRDVAAFT